MKKFIVIGLVLAIVAAFLIVPMLNRPDENTETVVPATFTFSQGLTIKANESIPLNIQVKGKSVAKLELIYNDSVFQTWKHPTGMLRVQLNAGNYGLGVRTLQLVSTLNDGSTKIDERILSVLSDIVPTAQKVTIINSYPHSTTSFTQGLEFSNGVLFEGTGQRGQSLVAEVKLTTGEQLKKTPLEATYFGEGISIFGDELFQLTWQEQTCFVYDKHTLQLKRKISYIGEGWGLCNNGVSLIMSDGSERLTVRSPVTFAIDRTIEVYDNLGPVSNLNELEYVNGLIYANVWMTNKIVVIDPSNGKVVSEIDCSELMAIGKGTAGDVFNGIAFNHSTKKWYMTGKNWMKLVEVSLN
jgi:glutamine cyclotransferase